MNTLADTESTHNQSSFELKTVLETSRMLVESRDAAFIANNVLLIIMGRLLVTKAAIFTHSSSKECYTLTKQKGIGGLDTNKEYSIKADCEDEGFTTADQVQTDIPALSKNGENTYFFNLRTSNHHHGYLVLGPKASGRDFTQDELNFVEGLCIISTAALVNSELFSELQQTYRNLDRRIHELNTLFELSKEFNLLVDRNQITRIFKLTLLGQLFIRTFFLIYDSEENPELLASSGLKSVPGQNQINDLYNSCNKDILIIEEEKCDEHPWLKENGIAALISVSNQNEKAALIGVGKRVNEIPFNENDINFLKSLANLAVISIQKTYFLEERIDKERMEEELSIAKSIQEGLMPDPIPAIPGVDLAAKTISSREVGGDYFDIADTPDGNSILCIADVTGKGVPAALLMANLQSMLHVLLPVDISLSEATYRMNKIIFDNTPSDKFITFFWAKYVHEHKILNYVNAGHNPPLLLRKDKNEFEELRDGGLLLGALDSIMPYKEKDIQLNPGDILICYTDGVDEAMSPDEEEFTVKRLKKTILKHRDKPSQQILDNIVAEITEHSCGKFSDDVTLLILTACE